jgi:D-glycero-alpha-D-manno-heptose 1-phosphate guanylyltransferase
MIEAVVLAGGLGLRLRTAVPDLPKPMAPVAGRPFLAWLLEALAGQGVQSAVLSVGYRAETIEGHFGASYAGLELRYAREAEPLGTGGALKRALRQVRSFPALALNGDSLVDLDLTAMRELHRRTRARLTIALVEAPDASRYGRVALREGCVSAFAAEGEPGPGLVNAGVYLMEAGLLDEPELPERFSFERDFLQPRVGSLAPAAFLASGRFIDIGVPEDFARAQTLFGRPSPEKLSRGCGR